MCVREEDIFRFSPSFRDSVGPAPNLVCQYLKSDNQLALQLVLIRLRIVMELAGHTQMKTTQLYLVGTDDQRKKAVRALGALG